jgi:transposase
MVGEGSAMTAERLKNSVCCLYADSRVTRIQAQLDDSRLGSGPRGRRCYEAASCGIATLADGGKRAMAVTLLNVVIATIKEEHMTTATTRQPESTARPILMMAFELAEAHWKLGFTTGTAQPARRRQVPARDVERLEREITAAKRRFGLAEDIPVTSCYEAGREGFWLHRWLEAHGVRNLVVDSSSIEVNRRARRTKTDRVDLDGLLRLLARYLAGERHAWSVVHVPSVTAEDARHLERELETVKQDRTRIVNRIRGLLATQGVRLPVTATLPEKLGSVRLWNGEPLPAGLHARLRREWQQLQRLQTRITALVAGRRAQLRTDRVAQPLVTLRGIGESGAAVLTSEFFGWRQFRNPRQVGALSGLTPTPYRSGGLIREQGIGKAGNRRVRAVMIQLGWAWLRFQPQSALARWYQQRFGEGGARLRRIGIVALARKLLIALWRYIEAGVLPEGAVVKAVAH